MTKIIIISTHQVRDLDHILQHLLILQEGKILLQKSIEQIQEEFIFSHHADQLNPEDLIYTMHNGELSSFMAHNRTGQRQNAHLETLITAIFEHPNLLQS